MLTNIYPCLHLATPIYALFYSELRSCLNVKCSWKSTFNESNLTEQIGLGRLINRLRINRYSDAQLKKETHPLFSYIDSRTKSLFYCCQS